MGEGTCRVKQDSKKGTWARLQIRKGEYDFKVGSRTPDYKKIENGTVTVIVRLNRGPCLGLYRENFKGEGGRIIPGRSYSANNGRGLTERGGGNNRGPSRCQLVSKRRTGSASGPEVT